MGTFLRNGLNPLLHEYNCGCVVAHHTNKPANGVEKAEWKGGDLAYLGSGSAEWANWPRAVLALRSVGSHDVFQLCAGKRGGRLGWKAADGTTKAYSKYLAHSKKPDEICWFDVPEGEEPAAPSRGQDRAKTKSDVMPHVPVSGAIGKEALKTKCNAAGIAQNSFNPLINQLIEDGTLFEWREKRPRTNDKISLSRFPQPEPAPSQDLPL